MADDGRQRLLIVDDEPLNRDLLRRALKSLYEIDEAADADAALAVLDASDGNVSAVLCDQLMPGRFGTELAAVVRERWPGKPFLLLTGYDDDPEVQRARASGLVDAVVTKPWSVKGLKALLVTMLSSAA